MTPTSFRAAPHRWAALRPRTPRARRAHGTQRVFVARGESLLRLRVELARGDFRLALFEPEAMQLCGQLGAAFVTEAELLGDPGPTPAPTRRTERGRVAVTRAFDASACSALLLELPPTRVASARRATRKISEPSRTKATSAF
jgi:hypothetical protein